MTTPTPETAMSPGEIAMLAEQVSVITAGHHLDLDTKDADDNCLCACGALVEDWDMHWAEVALAAVLPAVRAAERAKVAEEIAEPSVWPDPFGRWTADQADAARAMKEHTLRRITRGARP